MSKADLAYAAGFFDGEGNIGITIKHQEGYAQYFIFASVASTDEWACRRFHFMFGGYVRKRPPRKNPSHKPCWDWRVSSRQASNFLREVFPYLHLKRDRAELALKFQSAKHFTGRGRAKSDEEKTLEEAQFILMQSMNKRGVI